MAIWDHLWKVSPYGDVLFAALETYIPLARAGKSAWLWPVTREWLPRVDNWCHADKLGSLYSHLLEADPDAVLPELAEWNSREGEWERRVSLVSLIHYSGTNAVFLAPGQMLPLVANCVDDPRHYVKTAVGWVLREMRREYPGDVDAFLAQHESRMPGATVRRAKGV